MATQIFLIFTPIMGKINPFCRAYFSNGLVQPPTSLKRNVARISLKNGIGYYHSAILGQKFKTEMGTSLAEGHVAGKPNWMAIVGVGFSVS